MTVSVNLLSMDFYDFVFRLCAKFFFWYIKHSNVWPHIETRLQVCQKSLLLVVFSTLFLVKECDQTLFCNYIPNFLCVINLSTTFEMFLYGEWPTILFKTRNKKTVLFLKRPTSTHDVMALYSELIVLNVPSLKSYLGLRSRTGAW